MVASEGLAAPKSGRPERNSFFDKTESTSTSFPPTDNVEPGRRGELNMILPKSRPDMSCRDA
ncbi:hypothetical protein I7I50_07546 [Histoplasma capsulatum G186AR]|uniref:Uncharacterized protein n=1 Tax=Ajellomyces capsulatus TaxID=5037 RepID=A0A8H7YWD7_AJECA|nr:hypothetical protein I7I52_09382 [Histoplasma capsulatum]QSS68213.1 hypothetical protein I7I50_07546 [Histoplasma capsulatum G186AR]